MAYTALYRKWRPETFDEVKGQDAIVTTLKNQVITGRIGHAYLFCGTRGTGKTSIAKILAKAVNCENPIKGNPCGECRSCRAINASAAMNVVEIDAASNNGVDNIREIREEVKYSPAEGKYRVYIIDEVHMLSTGAFNALLKTLEEPPSYVIFVLATTEAHKIPVTVLSRCQRYDFKRIGAETIYGRLKEMTDEEGVVAEEKALRYIARKGDGSLRDSISLLERCVSFYFGKPLAYEEVLDILGAVDNEIYSRLIRFCINEDTAGSISLIDELVIEGRDLQQFTTEFIWYMRNLLLIQSAETAADILDMTKEDKMRLDEESRIIGTDTLMRYIRIFSELANQMRYASDKRVLLEIAVIKLTRPAMETNLDSVLQRLKVLEEKIEHGIVSSEAMSSGSALKQPAAGGNGLTDTEKQPERIVLPKAKLGDLRLIQKEWQKIIADLGLSIRPALAGSKLEPADDNSLCITFSERMNYLVGSREQVLEDLRTYVAKHYSKDISFITRLSEIPEAAPVAYVSEEELHEKIHMDIMIEEDL